MSEYAILIYQDPTSTRRCRRRVGEGGRRDDMFTKQVSELGGSLTGGEALAPVTTATTIKGGGAVTDGPFVQSKEALLGYYVVEARDLDHAVEIGKLCPATGGGVEVRPLVDPTVKNPF